MWSYNPVTLKHWESKWTSLFEYSYRMNHNWSWCADHQEGNMSSMETGALSVGEFSFVVNFLFTEVDGSWLKTH